MIGCPITALIAATKEIRMRPFLFTLMLSILVAAITGCGDPPPPRTYIYVRASQMTYANELVLSKGEKVVVNATIIEYVNEHDLPVVDQNEIHWVTNNPGILKLEPSGSTCVVTALHDPLDAPNDIPPTTTLTVKYHGKTETRRTYIVTNLAGLWQFSFDDNKPVDLNLDQDGSLIAVRNSQKENRGEVTLTSTVELMFEGRQLVGKISTPNEIGGTYNAKGDNSSSWSSGHWTATKLTPTSH